MIVFDEAHQLPDIASQYFGQSVTSRQLFDLCKDIQITYRTEVKDMKQLGVAVDQLLKIVQDFRLMLGEGNLRGNWRQMLQQSAVKKAFDFLLEKLNFTAEVVKLGLARSQTLDSILESIAQLQN